MGPFGAPVSLQMAGFPSSPGAAARRSTSVIEGAPLEAGRDPSRIGMEGSISIGDGDLSRLQLQGRLAGPRREPHSRSTR